MKNKKAQFFGIYLVVITLVMCVLAILLYYSQAKQTENSLVSPVKMMELRDRRVTFELEEQALIISILDEIGGSGWGGGDFIDRFKSKFFVYFNSDRGLALRDFLDKDLVGGRLSVNELYNSEDNKISFVSEGGKTFLVINRKRLEKSFKLEAQDKSNKNNFPVDVEYYFEAKYLISYSNNQFSIRKVN